MDSPSDTYTGTMRREQVFGRDGAYRAVLASNALLHREAREAVTALARDGLRRRSGPTRVLDLACGGEPVTIAGVMRRLSPRRFTYLGVDIHADQVRHAREHFDFSGNVSDARVVEGNAWDPASAGITGPFELIFSGMNLHHGTPQEIHYLGTHLVRLLAPHGLFVSHDVYRPDREPYYPRPAAAASGGPMELVTPKRLAEATPAVPSFEFKPWGGEDEPAWRLDYLARMERALLRVGTDRACIDSVCAHMRERDYPVSLAELEAGLTALGLEATRHPLGAQEEPLAPYIGLVSARPQTPGG